MNLRVRSRGLVARFLAPEHRRELSGLAGPIFGKHDCDMSDSRLRNKTALITGATSNIGRAIAIEFAAEGAHVVASGRSPQRGAELIEEIKASGGRAEFFPADLDGTEEASRALAAGAARVL